MGLFNNLVTGVATSILANEQAKKDATARIKADVAVLHNLITLAGVGVKEDSLKTQATDMVTGRVEEICKLKAIAERKIAEAESAKAEAEKANSEYETFIKKQEDSLRHALVQLNPGSSKVLFGS